MCEIQYGLGTGCVINERTPLINNDSVLVDNNLINSYLVYLLGKPLEIVGYIFLLIASSLASNEKDISMNLLGWLNTLGSILLFTHGLIYEKAILTCIMVIWFAFGLGLLIISNRLVIPDLSGNLTNII
jgi:hypothetical protein